MTEEERGEPVHEPDWLLCMQKGRGVERRRLGVLKEKEWVRDNYRLVVLQVRGQCQEPRLVRTSAEPSWPFLSDPYVDHAILHETNGKA